MTKVYSLAKKADMLRTAFLMEAHKNIDAEMKLLQHKKNILAALPSVFTQFQLAKCCFGYDIGELELAGATGEQALKAFNSVDTLPFCSVGGPRHAPRVIPVCRTEIEMNYFATAFSPSATRKVDPPVPMEGSCFLRVVAELYDTDRSKVFGWLMLEGTVVMVQITLSDVPVQLRTMDDYNVLRKARYKKGLFRKAWPEAKILHAAITGSVCVLSKWKKN